MINPKEQAVLVAYDPDALRRLAEAFDGFAESHRGGELRAIVESGRVPVSKPRRERAAKELARLRDMGAPDVLLRHQAYLADPKKHVMGRIERHDDELTFEELCGFIAQDRLVVWEAGICWGLLPQRRQEVEQALHGSTTCVLSDKPRFPHWREELREDAKDIAKDRFGDRWNHNFHEDVGVDRAQALLVDLEAPTATTSDAAECPSYRYRMILTHGYAKQGSGFEFGGAISRWPEDPRPHAAKALRLVAKQLPPLREFFGTCHAHGRHVHSRPREL